MNRLGVLSTAAMLLLLGNTASAYPRQEQHEQDAKPEAKPEAKPANQPETKPVKPEPAKTEKQQETQPPKQEATKPAKQEETKPEKQEAAKPEKQQQQAKSQPAQAKSSTQQHAQRTPAEEQKQRAVPALRLSARGSARIPDDRFRANFGREHVFVISQPEMVGGYSRFQYGGFWFGFVQPWPVGWYYTDDVYVDYVDGGYYLYNPYYPGARVSISVVL
jgi:hypothetical protein